MQGALFMLLQKVVLVKARDMDMHKEENTNGETKASILMIFFQAKLYQFDWH